jgi:hypothetical protein
MTKLTAEQHEELVRAGDSPVRVEDPITREPYVIVKAAIFEKLRAQFEIEKIDPSFHEYGEFTPRNP